MSKSVYSGVITTLLAIQTAEAAPVGRLYVGTDQGVFAQVRAVDLAGNVQSQPISPFEPTFTGGVRVASGDVNGDGIADIITAAGPGGGPHVKVLSGSDRSQLHSFFPYTPSFTGGVNVAAGDLNGDGVADVITGAGVGGGGHVRVFDGNNAAPIRDFFAFDPNFTGGVRVAGGDINGDGRDDIITGSTVNGHVKVFDGRTGNESRSFNAFATGFTGGVFVASGDVTGDGIDDLVAGADSGLSLINVFAGPDFGAPSVITPFGGFSGGVRVAVGDLTGDGRADLIAGSGPGGGDVRIFDFARGTTIDLQPFGASYTGGIFVAAIPEPAAIGIFLALAFVGRRRKRGTSNSKCARGGTGVPPVMPVRRQEKRGEMS